MVLLLFLRFNRYKQNQTRNRVHFPHGCFEICQGGGQYSRTEWGIRYSVPDSLDGKVLPGCLVEVPFNNRALQGVVTRFVDIPEVADPKPVTALVDPIPVVTSQQLELAVWMADETLTPICQCIDLMLPPGLASQADTLYENISNDENLRGLDQTET
jgi:primosomal protein N'